MRRLNSGSTHAGPVPACVLRAGIAIVTVVGLITMAGCSPASRHQVLTFFFTGVPPLGGVPEAVSVPAPQPTQAVPVRVGLPTPHTARFWVHGPYASRKCDRCHTPSDPRMPSDMGHVKSGKACEGCHTAFFAALNADPSQWVHGPVANGNCTTCHHPHRSPNRFMLRVEPAKLCDSCHGFRAAPENPAHLEAEGACLNCHDPHSGATPAILARKVSG